MNVIINGLRCLVLFVYYLFEAIIMTFVPVRWRAKSVEGQTVLITGAGSGLGRLTSIEFAKLGSKLVLLDINESGNDETARLAGAHTNNRIDTYKCDLSSREDTYRVCKQVLDEVGKVDILINNAGIVAGKRIQDIPDHLIEKTMQINSVAHFWTVKSFLPKMLETNHGHIVTIASCAGLFGHPCLVDYCASKFAAVGFDESLRNELYAVPNCHVKTTVVCPVFINTGMFQGVKSPMFLNQHNVVRQIVDAILTDRFILVLPRYMSVLYTMKTILPIKCLQIFGEILGADKAMDNFQGRREGQKTD